MKIAYIVPSLQAVGPVIVVHTLITNLLKLYDNSIELIHVYYFDDKPTTLKFPCPTFKIKENELIEFEKYDILHSHCLRPDKYLFKNKKYLKNVKTVSTIHQDIFEDIKYQYNYVTAFIFTPLWLRYLRSLDYTVPISKKIESLYKNKLKNLTLPIYNGVDIIKNIPSNNLVTSGLQQFKKDGLYVIMTYANVTKRKGLEQLLYLAKYRSDVGIVIIGEGSDKLHLKKLSEKLHLDNRILFLPFLPNPYTYLKYADMYAITSRSEGFGLALVEGVLSKVPVLASSIEVFKELFSEKEISFFELDNVGSLNHAFEKILSKRDGFINNAYVKALKTYTGEIMASNYFSFYNFIVL